MFQLTFDFNKNNPLYIQLYRYLKKQIKNGTFQPHMKLPSKRKLSAHLNISQNTVEAAYDQLTAEGYIKSIPRKGYYVCKIEPPFININSKNMHTEEKEYRSTKYLYNFDYAELDSASFPYKLYKKIINNILKTESKDFLNIGHPQGEFSLRKEISEYLYQSRGVNCLPNQIIIGSGTQTLMLLIFKLLPQKKIAVENPGYHRTLLFAEKDKKMVNLIPLDEYGMNFNCLRQSNSDIAIITPSHQFPYGMTMPITKRLEFLKWANSMKGRYIIEDDYDSEFRYSSKPIPSLQGLDNGENVIYMGTFSKLLAPTLRVSYVVLPPALLNSYQKNLFFFASTVSLINQKFLREYLNKGHWATHVQKMRLIYQKKREVLVKEINNNLGDTVDIIGDNAGLHLLLRFKNDLTEKEAILRASKAGVKINSVSDYGGNDKKTVLLGFASLSEEEIKQAVALLAREWS